MYSQNESVGNEATADTNELEKAAESVVEEILADTADEDVDQTNAQSKPATSEQDEQGQTQEQTTQSDQKFQSGESESPETDEEQSAQEQSQEQEQTEEDTEYYTWTADAFADEDVFDFGQGRKVTWKQIKEVIDDVTPEPDVTSDQIDEELAKQEQTEEEAEPESKKTEKPPYDPIYLELVEDRLNREIAQHQNKYFLVDKKMVMDELKRISASGKPLSFKLVEPVMRKLHTQLEKVVERYQKIKQTGATKKLSLIHI